MDAAANKAVAEGARTNRDDGGWRVEQAVLNVLNPPRPRRGEPAGGRGPRTIYDYNPATGEVSWRLEHEPPPPGTTPMG